MSELLQQQMAANINTGIHRSVVSNSGSCKTEIVNNQLQEEYSLAMSQVQFLNSIIVDMQNKNEELRTKIEVLESSCYNGGSVASGTVLNSNIQAVHAQAPRQYCDICEIFDAHETEDCPIQIGEQEINQVTRTFGDNERAYCEHCEAFGHETADCDASETY